MKSKTSPSITQMIVIPPLVEIMCMKEPRAELVEVIVVDVPVVDVPVVEVIVVDVLVVEVLVVEVIVGVVEVTS